MNSSKVKGHLLSSSWTFTLCVRILYQLFHRCCYSSRRVSEMTCARRQSIIIAQDTCGPCKLMFAHYEKLPPVFKSIKFAKFNVGKEGHNEVASRNRIRALPTFKLYQGGKKRQLSHGLVLRYMDIPAPHDIHASLVFVRRQGSG